MYQKCSFGQSHKPQNQHWKSQQDQAKKKQNTKSQIQVCVEVPKDSLNCYLM
jgi:hypothetical protein